MTKVLDTHALMVFFEKEPGYEKVKSLFSLAMEKDSNLLMTSVNYGEIYCIVLRERGLEKAEEIEHIIKTLPIDIVDVDIDLAREAGKIKAHYKLSYADCFAAGLARMKKGEVITGDPEFECIKNLIKVCWI